MQRDDGTRHAGACVLTLVARVGKCEVKDLEGAHRIATVKTWNVPFLGEAAQGEAPPHTDIELKARFVSYCTMSNVQYFTLSSRKSQQPVYAMVVVGSAHLADNVTTFMINKVQIVDPADVQSICKVFGKLSMLSKSRCHDATPRSSTPTWSDTHTPFRAKKTRRLTATPTDASMD